MTTLLVLVGALALAGAYATQLVRWLRVLQREHYEPSAMFQFLGRWSSPNVASAKAAKHEQLKRPITLTHVCLFLLVLFLVLRTYQLVVVVTVAYGLFAPHGLSLRGRTSKLQWTRRLKVTAVVASVLALGVGVLGLITRWPLALAVLVVWSVPQLLDLTTRLLRPYEERNAKQFVDQAAKRLARVAPLVVGITGSYGKTSTKNHLRDLLERDGGIVATPKSFNNRAGLSRAINENLADGTRVFIAEMGTYGPGEIAALCAWCPPSLSIVTAIGPVHLERMKNLETIERAKFEITGQAKTVVVNIDDPMLARWPSRMADKKVVTAGSTNDAASVRVVAGETWRVLVDGTEVATLAPLASVQPTNLACAVAAALELGLTPDQLPARLSGVAPVANRANVVTAPSGVQVIDDTFNANPASAAAALAMLRGLSVTGRRVVVTPGLIELGPEQWRENVKLANLVHASGAELVIVGRTNARALQTGYDGPVKRVDTRDEAVAWVREVLVIGDGVLYLNDLPDHYP